MQTCSCWLLLCRRSVRCDDVFTMCLVRSLFVAVHNTFLSHWRTEFGRSFVCWLWFSWQWRFRRMTSGWFSSTDRLWYIHIWIKRQFRWFSIRAFTWNTFIFSWLVILMTKFTSYKHSFTEYLQFCLTSYWQQQRYLHFSFCRGGPAPDRLSAALVSRKFAVARARVRGPRQQADVSAAGWCNQVIG